MNIRNEIKKYWKQILTIFVVLTILCFGQCSSTEKNKTNFSGNNVVETSTKSIQPTTLEETIVVSSNITKEQNGKLVENISTTNGNEKIPLTENSDREYQVKIKQDKKGTTQATIAIVQDGKRYELIPTTLTIEKEKIGLWQPNFTLIAHSGATINPGIDFDAGLGLGIGLIKSDSWGFLEAGIGIDQHLNPELVIVPVKYNPQLPLTDSRIGIGPYVKIDIKKNIGCGVVFSVNL